MATTQKTANPAREQERTALRCNAAVEFGREVCGSLELADEREWLVTNGIGGYASGTVSGDLTRRYHGLLVAALHDGKTLGEATLEAKKAVTDADVRASFQLLGDPSARAVATHSSALSLPAAPRTAASGCATQAAPVAGLAPLVLLALALSAWRRRTVPF